MRHSPDTFYLISQHGAAVKTILSVRHSKPLVCKGVSKNWRNRYLSGNSASSVKYPATTKCLFCFLIIQILHRSSPKMPTPSFWHSSTHPYQNSDWGFYFWLRPSSSKNPSFRPSVCLCVRHTFLTMFLSSYQPEIVRCYYHWQTWCYAKGQGQRGHDPT